MNSKVGLEVVWWIATGLAVAVVMFPIWSAFPPPGFPFSSSNVVFIVAFITFTRYIFLLKYTFLAYRQYVKIAMILVGLMVTLSLIIQLNDFQRLASESIAGDIMKGVSIEKQESVWSYIKTELPLFAIGSIIASIVLPVRLLMSVWRVRNQAGV